LQAEAGSSKIPVGQVIAMLAEEGDDLATIEVPKDLAPEGQASGSSSSSQAEPKKEEPKKEEKKAEVAQTEKKDHGHKTISHPKPLFPSVARM
jgi:pyruvate/2-oxoglutarate dehydrogenase complex dihydrolipoamide acyltransferase (E2) component